MSKKNYLVEAVGPRGGKYRRLIVTSAEKDKVKKAIDRSAKRNKLRVKCVKTVPYKKARNMFMKPVKGRRAATTKINGRIARSVNVA